MCVCVCVCVCGMPYVNLSASLWKLLITSPQLVISQSSSLCSPASWYIAECWTANTPSLAFFQDGGQPLYWGSWLGLPSSGDGFLMH